MKRLIILFAAAMLLLLPVSAFAHCDTLDGPVAKAGRAALAQGNLAPSLKWVHSEYEPELRAAFERALRVSKSGDAEARALAEQFFLETLVRLHRAGEGAPFDGLKPAGTVEPAIAHADAALESGAVGDLSEHLAQSIASELRTRFAAARAGRAKQDANVGAGREFVAAYVSYVHYVEAVANLAHAGAHEHDAAAAAHQH